MSVDEQFLAVVEKRLDPCSEADEGFILKCFRDLRARAERAEAEATGLRKQLTTHEAEASAACQECGTQWMVRVEFQEVEG